MRSYCIIISILNTFLLMLSVSCVIKEYPAKETYYITENMTEYKSETYNEIQKVIINTTKDRTFLTPAVKWNDSLYSAELGPMTPLTFYYGYELYVGEHSNSEVEVTLSPGVNDQRGYILVLDLTSVGQIPPGPTYGWWFPSMRETHGEWIANVNAKVRAARVLDRLWLGPSEASRKGYIKFDAKGVRVFAIMISSYYTDAILNVELTWSDDIVQQKLVTKIRQVPYQVPIQVEKQRTVTKMNKVPFWEAIFGK